MHKGLKPLKYLKYVYSELCLQISTEQQVGNLSSLTKKSRAETKLHSKQNRKLARSCFS
jgi:hypothetical protein